MAENSQEPKEQIQQRRLQAPLRASFIQMGDRVTQRHQDNAYYAPGYYKFERPMIPPEARGEVVGFALHTLGRLRNDWRVNRPVPGLYRNPQVVCVRFDDGMLVHLDADQLSGIDQIWEARINQALTTANGAWRVEDTEWLQEEEGVPLLGERLADLPEGKLYEGDIARPEGAWMPGSLKHPFEHRDLFRVGALHFYHRGWESLDHGQRVTIMDRTFAIRGLSRTNATIRRETACTLIRRGPLFLEGQGEVPTFQDMKEEATYRALIGEAVEVGDAWHDIHRRLSTVSPWEYDYHNPELRSEEEARAMVRNGQGHGITFVEMNLFKVSTEHYCVLTFANEELGQRVRRATLEDSLVITPYLAY